MKQRTIFLFIFVSFVVNYSFAQTIGCPDPKASNYNSKVTLNDGSCLYSTTSISSSSSVELNSLLSETSGLVSWGGEIWTHNDNTDTSVYALDPINGTISGTYALPGVTNVDWEELSQDETYLYVGDFGNNTYGNRKDLKILRISKNSLLNNSPQIDTISFSYPNQTDFLQKSNNSTDFDCESFIVSSDTIFLFTKQWISKQTTLYALPKTPGNYTAQLRSTFNVGGLITGASYIEDKKLIVLCGYSLTTYTLDPFVYLLYDFKGYDFFGGNKRKIKLNLSYHQVEGIASINGLQYYISNEAFSKSIINTPQKLQTLDLSNYLSDYLLQATMTDIDKQRLAPFKIFPNPASNFIHISIPDDTLVSHYGIVNQMGETVQVGRIYSKNEKIDISRLPSGAFVVLMYGNSCLVKSTLLFKK